MEQGVINVKNILTAYKILNYIISIAHMLKCAEKN